MKLHLIWALCFAFTSIAQAAPEYILVIDPGHGGKADSGSSTARTLSSSNNATSPGGIEEKDITLDLSKQVREAIKSEASRQKIKCKVVLTREDDSNPDFAERTKRSLSAGVPDVIFSIHFNASDSHKGLGSLAMIGNRSVNPNFDTDQRFANGLSAACSAAVQKFLPDSRPKSTITDSHLHGGKGSNFFFQMAKYPELKTVPKCFLEVEFMDRSDVENSLIKKRQQAFPEIASSIAAYLISYVTSK